MSFNRTVQLYIHKIKKENKKGVLKNVLHPKS